MERTAKSRTWADLLRGSKKVSDLEPGLQRQAEAASAEFRKTQGRQQNSEWTSRDRITAIYFKKVERGPIVRIKQCLRKRLAFAATLQVYFVGKDTLELLCITNWAEDAVSYMFQILGCEHMQGFDALQDFDGDYGALEPLECDRKCAERFIDRVTRKKTK